MPDLNIASGGRSALLASVAVSLVALANAPAANAADVNVTVTTATAEGQPNQFPGGLRWTLEEDVTHDVDPTAPPASPLDSPTMQLHKSYMPLAQTGSSASASFTITGLDASKRYYLSVLPDRPAGSACTTTGDKCYTMSGAPVRFATPASTTTSTLVTLTAQPLPPAQAHVFAFDDTAPINNSWDAGEAGLGGFTVFIYDMGGPMVTDLFGNPIGTEYESGTLDGDASPTITRLGDGTIHTMTAAEVNDPVRNPHHLKVGEALIQNIAPGKYGIQVVPPEGEGWHQTTTIEGTKGIDVWIRAGEPMFAVEFGPTFAHAAYGFVKEFDHLGSSANPGRIQGQVVNLRVARPPSVVETLGQPLPLCWVGLNEMASGTGLYVAPCDDQSKFDIAGVPPGTYQLVVWDQYLDVIISFFTVVVGPGETVLAGDNGLVGVPRWFGSHEHYVFNDLNENGVWDQPEEKGIPDQTINFRFRDGSLYQSSTTDTLGFLPFDEIFPFGSWLVAEVDFARFKATGATITVDDGGPVVDGPVGRGKLNPQIQADNQPTRTELSEPVPVLLEGFNMFPGNTNIFEWGKKAYGANENGGITGVVYNQTTRAENDPRFAAAETWEPGIPRVQLNLYRADATGVIQNNDGTPGIQLADVDNYPFGWQDGGAQGPEDIDRHPLNPLFDLGDAIEAGHTDSWDDNVPTDCVGDTLAPDGRCYDGLRNFQQVRPAVFDGGYAFGFPFSVMPLAPGSYVVEAVPPPGYKVQDEASKNVDFGDTFVPHALPPVCVGDAAHTGGNQIANHYDDNAELSLFPGVEIDSAYWGDRPVCNFKQIVVADGKNAAADFFLYTDVPVSGHIQGLTTNDIANDTDPNSPNFGEKLGPSNVPISIRDHAGNELNRVYTDAYGHYEGLVPSTYRINVPMPSGVSPGMVQVCINPPTKADPAHLGGQIPDPYFDPRYSQSCYSLNFTPGQTTYLDTPIIPVAAFVGTPNWQLDCNYPDGTPIIRTASVGGNGFNGGPYIAPGGSRILTLSAVGSLVVADPANPRPATITRDYGFGDAPGKVFLNGAEITTGITWGATEITVNVPNAAPFLVTGQLEIQRANGLRTVHGITLIQGVPAASVRSVSAGSSIQSAIDSAPAGGVVLVGPGLYYESLFMTKPIQLQGWGAAGTVINAGRSASYANLLNWRAEAQRRANCAATPVLDRIGLLPGQSNNTGGDDPCAYEPGTGLFTTEEAAGVLVAPRPNVFGAQAARIDGFTITSADFSGAIIANGFATNLEISNNVLVNNQGVSAAGIRIGHQSLFDANAEAANVANGTIVDAQNRNVRIHHNNVTQNGSLEFAVGGGIGLYTGSDNYRVASNYVCGNFTQGDGAGIGHFGRSPGGVIENNQILFNQSFDQTAQLTGGAGGGILVEGHPQPVGAAIPQTGGTGSVQILGNRIQGNQAGSSDGGGIALRFVNGQDVLASLNDASWNRVDILNNLIVNNVAALAGGGIVLQDALRVSIINNTIVNNDSTATAAAAFADPNVSDPQPAGVVSRAHSLELQALPQLLVGTFSNPTLGNNIILGNRMQHWEATPGGLVVDGVQDLAVLGTAGQRGIL